MIIFLRVTGLDALMNEQFATFLEEGDSPISHPCLFCCNLELPSVVDF